MQRAMLNHRSEVASRKHCCPPHLHLTFTDPAKHNMTTVSDSTANMPSPSMVYTRQDGFDSTLDDARLSTGCTLHATRSDIMPREALFPLGQLDNLPHELLIEILLHCDLVSLATFRRVNRRATKLVDSISQYGSILKNCPDIIRAVLSIQATSYDCQTLYQTLCTTQCSSCDRFGDYLYLITCKRVCYACFTTRTEYLPLETRLASCHFAAHNPPQQNSGKTFRDHLLESNIPNILSLPGRYASTWPKDRSKVVRKRVRLFDRRAVMNGDATNELPMLDRTTCEPRRFMAIISAPHLYDRGRKADWGYFCLGCRDESDPRDRESRARIKFAREEIMEHFEAFGDVKPVKGVAGRFMHIRRMS